MIKNFIKAHNIEFYENVSLKKYNTYKLDVTCKYVVFPDDLGTLVLLLNFLKENNIKYLVLGNGSNIILSINYDPIKDYWLYVHKGRNPITPPVRNEGRLF